MWLLITAIPYHPNLHFTLHNRQTGCFPRLLHWSALDLTAVPKQMVHAVCVNALLT